MKRRESHCAILAALIALAATVAYAPPGRAAEARDPYQVANRLDQLLASEVFADAKPAPRADDETFLRRVYFDLLGGPPSPGEITAFVLDPAQDKRQRVVDRLLADRRYGQNWARYWRDVIMYRRSEDRALITARPLEEFLAEHLNKNTGWDEIARAFITTKGNVRTDGHTAIVMAQNGRPEETVSEISRIFLGIQIQCAQCHDHPTDRWKREQFHELAAFFPRVAVRPQRVPQRTFVVVADDRPGFRRANNNNRFRGTLEHYMPDLSDPNGRGQRMQPKLFTSGQSLPFGSTDEKRRETLARWITSPESEWFAKAMVNRMWSELVGEGFFEPIDDIGPDRTPTAPKTLNLLAESFAKSGYDIKWLVRTITATDAYQRASRSRRNVNETPFLASAPQRLRGDQLFSSLAMALDVAVDSRGANPRGPYPTGQRFAFNAIFGYDPSVQRGEVVGSIPQALAMMNSPVVNQAIGARRGGGLGRLLATIKDDEALVAELYLKALAREPTEQEVAMALDYMKEVGNRGEACEDLLWALVNSTEFLFRK